MKRLAVGLVVIALLVAGAQLIQPHAAVDSASWRLTISLHSRVPQLLLRSLQKHATSLAEPVVIVACNAIADLCRQG